MMPAPQCRRKPSLAALAAVTSMAGAPALAALQQPRQASQPEPPPARYWVYVGAESADLIHRVRFGPDGAVVERTIAVGESPVETEGPHGLAISADGRYLHFTTGHGSPDGKYWRYVLGPDTLAGPGVFLGFFPASLDVTPDGLFAFVVNFNLHGEMVPSSVSVVYTPSHTEVARIETCTMPHGSRVAADGLHQYSACMMDDQLVEIDARALQVSRRFSFRAGAEGPVAGAGAAHAGHAAPMTPAATPETSARRAMAPPTCSPTWAQPSADGSRIYVACNRSDVIVEVDRRSWSVARRFRTGRGPYNLAVTPDGRLLVVTLKQGGAVQVFDLDTGSSVYQTPSSTTLTHGVAVSPDSRYAFVSAEGVGAAPGKVDVYDLRALARVATVDVGQQASGIAFWKMEPAN